MKVTKELIRKLVLEVLDEAQFGQRTFEKDKTGKVVSWRERTDDPDAPPDSPEGHAHWLRRATEAGVDVPIQGQEGYVLPPPEPRRPEAQEPTKLARRRRPKPKVRVS